MEGLFAWVNSVLHFVGPLSDFFWDFPTMFGWYKMSAPFRQLFSGHLGAGGLRGVFHPALGLCPGDPVGAGHSAPGSAAAGPHGDFAPGGLSPELRHAGGAGEHLGRYRGYAVGGPGALFWMWVSGFFGMATAFVEATLAQLFKERRGGEFVGGLPFYGRELLGGKKLAGILLSCLYIFYALGCLPAQGFNVVSSLGAIAEMVTGSTIPTNSFFYYAAALVVLVFTGVLAFGGIQKVTRATNKMVPVMAVVYVGTVLLLIFANVQSVPFFFQEVFRGAFRPDAFFGGVFGTVLVQGREAGPHVQRSRRAPSPCPPLPLMTTTPVNRACWLRPGSCWTPISSAP